VVINKTVSTHRSPSLSLVLSVDLWARASSHGSSSLLSILLMSAVTGSRFSPPTWCTRARVRLDRPARSLKCSLVASDGAERRRKRYRAGGKGDFSPKSKSGTPAWRVAAVSVSRFPIHGVLAHNEGPRKRSRFRRCSPREKEREERRRIANGILMPKSRTIAAISETIVLTNTPTLRVPCNSLAFSLSLSLFLSFSASLLHIPYPDPLKARAHHDPASLSASVLELFKLLSISAEPPPPPQFHPSALPLSRCSQPFLRASERAGGRAGTTLVSLRFLSSPFPSSSPLPLAEGSFG